MKLSYVLQTASALALIAAGPAFAQDANVPPPGNTPPTGAQAQDQADDQSSDQGNDIIVTASKRETTLQDTPIAVSVATAETIQQAQARDLIDVQTLVPSLRVAQLQSSANTNFIIRGFGNGANNAGIEPSVGVFIDGVYRSRSAAQIGDLPNIRRIEVLRGPQSTLFGKNASAGIISIVTQEPQFSWGGHAELSYGNYNAIVARADVTGPISDTLAFSLYGNYNRRDGYARDLNLNTDFNDRNRYGFRGQLLWEPSDAFKVRLIGDIDQIDENCCIAGNVINGPTGAAIVAVGGRIDAANPFSYNVYNNFPSSNDIRNWGLSGQADYEFGALTLTSITAYREVKSRTNQDSDFTSADLIGQNRNALDINTFTQELRLASDFDGPLNFLVGGFYFREDIVTSDALTYGTAFRNYANILSNGAINTVEALTGTPTGTFFAAGQGLFNTFNYSNDAFSLFGTADWEVTDRLTLTLGLAYTDDRKRVSSSANSTDVFSGLDLTAIGRQAVLNQAIATTVGQILRLPGAATAAQVQAFAAANAAAFAQVQAGATAFANANATNAAVNPLLALRPLQFLPPFLNFPNAVENGRTRDDNLSYTIRAAYDLTDNINLYATYATGFKASSWNLSRDSRPFASDFIPGSPVTNPPTSPIRAAGLAVPNLTTGSRYAGPETAEVYEIGLKAQFDRVAFNIALFDQKLKGFQSNIFTGTGFALANAGQQSVRGIEFDGSVRPVDPLTITLAFTYLDPRYDSFVNTGIPVPGQPTPQQGGPQLDLSGQRPAGIPQLAFSLGGAYVHEFAGGSTLTFRADYSYESQVQVVENVSGIDREIDNLNGSVILGLTNGLELSLWGRNLLNSRYLTTVFPSVAQSGSISGYPNQPRTYGVAARFTF